MMKRSLLTFFAAALAGVWLLEPVLHAQSTGTIRGVVKDPSGGVVPGANVVLTNTATRQESEAVTTAVGSYAFTFLAPGRYTVDVNLAGFNRFERTGVAVDVAGVVVLDVVLQVGAVADTVTVAGEAPQLQLTTSSLGQVVENKMMNGVPLSSRNFTQILALSPGVSSNAIDAGALGRNSVNISANGARPWDNNVVLNGLNADNPMSQGFDDAPDKTGVPVPAPDAIEQFRVQTGLYDAEFGKQGGAVINVVTKSGSADFRGSLYEFFRDDALNSNDYFRKQNGASKPILSQNQYGASLGGPMVAKSFFFVSYQGTKQRNGVSSSSNKNTFLPLLGDRSAATLGAMYGGQTGIFGGVPIAADGSNINPVALAILNGKFANGQYLVPDPQSLRNGVGFSSLSEPAIFDEKQLVTNVDIDLTGKQRLMVKSFYARSPTTLPFQLSTNVLGFGETDYHSNANLAVSHTYVINPTTVNELRAGYSRSYLNQSPFEPITARDIGMVPPVPERVGMPSIAVSGMFTIGTNRNNDQRNLIQMLEVADTMSKVIGRHQLRIGGSVNPTRVTRQVVFVQRGEMRFLSFPDFLLGMSGAQNGTPFSNISQTLVGNGRVITHPAFNNFAAFLQDDFRMNDRLSLNLGMRYQFNGQQYNTDGLQSNYDFRNYPVEGPPPEGTLAGLVIPKNAPADIATPPGVVRLDHNTLADKQNTLGFSPRVGFSWRPVARAQNFVLRGGYGLFWSAVAGTLAEGVGVIQPFYNSVNGGGAVNPGATFQNPFPDVPLTSAFPLYVPVKLGSNQTIYPFNPENKQPHAHQYSVNVQAELKGVLVQLGYVGSRTTNIIGFVAPNQALLASPESPVHGQTTNTIANRALRVPYVGFAPGVDGIGQFSGTYDGQPYEARYNSLQASVSKRYSHGLSFSTAYTFSRSIDNINAGFSGRQQSLGGVTGDFHNPAEGPSSFNRTHTFVASYLWELPARTAAGPVASTLLNGWSVSGVVTIESGLPFSITDGRGGTIYGASSYAQFADGKGPSDVPKGGDVEDRLGQFFNKDVFVAPPRIGDGTGFGDAPRNFMTGPGLWNADMALVKVFKLRGTHVLEVRSEFFNLFNHSNFGNPGSNASNAGSFGVISSTVTAPRIIQLAARYRF